MRGRTVLILLILVVGLVAFIELYEHELPSSEERAALERLVLDVEADEISFIEIAWQDQRVHLRKSSSEALRPGWALEKPLSAAADETLVSSLIESLSSLETKRSLEGTTPAEVGLDPPRMAVRIQAEDRELGLFVGSEVPAGDLMIVRPSGSEEILVVDNGIWTVLVREPGQWRSRQVFEGIQSAVQKVTLEQDGRGIVLVRRDGEFWLDSPLADRAAQEEIDGLLATLASMSVASFADEWPEVVTDTGLDPPIGTVEIEEDSVSAPWRLEWGAPVADSDSQHYARSAGLSFTTEADLGTYLELDVEAWRSLGLTSLDTFEIDELEVVQKDQESVTLRRDGANWQRNEDEIDFSTVSDLLYALTGAEAGALLSPDGFDSATAEEASGVVLEVKLDGRDSPQTLTFLEPGDEGIPVRVSDREVVLFLGQDEFTEILAKVERVRAARSVKSPSAEQLSSNTSELSSDQ